MLWIYFSLAAAFAMFAYGAYKALLVFPPIYSPENPVMEELYRNVFFHVPVNASGFLGFTITLFASILYLKTRDMKYDLIAAKSAKVGVFFITFTLLTGMAWAKPAWGTYWNWDPRETTALIMWFVYLGYLALREAIAEERARARASAILGIFGYTSGIFTLLSTRIFPSLHPPTFGLRLEPEMGMTLGLMITGAVIVFLNLVYLEMRLERVKRGLAGGR